MFIGLKKYYPQLDLSLNGGVKTIEQSLEHLQHIDGVMIGNNGYSNPFILNEVGRKVIMAHCYTDPRQ